MSPLNTFVAYCWEFYAPGKLDGEFFDNNLTRAELAAACALRMATVADFVGDSFDRECVREILFFARDSRELARLSIG